MFCICVLLRPLFSLPLFLYSGHFYNALLNLSLPSFVQFSLICSIKCRFLATGLATEVQTVFWDVIAAFRLRFWLGTWRGSTSSQVWRQTVSL